MNLVDVMIGLIILINAKLCAHLHEKGLNAEIQRLYQNVVG